MHVPCTYMYIEIKIYVVCGVLNHVGMHTFIIAIDFLLDV